MYFEKLPPFNTLKKHAKMRNKKPGRPDKTDLRLYNLICALLIYAPLRQTMPCTSVLAVSEMKLPDSGCKCMEIAVGQLPGSQRKAPAHARS